MDPTTAASAAGVVTLQAAQVWLIALLWGLVVVLGGILAWFIKRLVDKLEEIQETSSNLTVAVSQFSLTVQEVQAQGPRIRELEIEVARMQAAAEARHSKKNGGIGNGRRATISDD